MKRELKIWAVILGIIVAGMGITKFTEAYVSTKRTQMDIAGMADAGGEKAAEEAAEGALLSDAAAGADAAEGGEAAPRAALTAEDPAEPADGASIPGPDARQGQAGASKEGSDEEDLADPARTAVGAVRNAERAALPEGVDTAGSVSSTGETEAGDILADEMDGGAMDGLSGGEPVLVAGSLTAAAGGAAEVAEEDGGSDAEDYRDKLEDYQYRLSELDAQIERMRSAETENTVQAVKSAAKTELRIWERELEAVYSLLIVSLDEGESDTLREEQQAWIIERDIAAQEASRKNSGSVENVVYTASIAASTRERVYYLVDRYR